MASLRKCVIKEWGGRLSLLAVGRPLRSSRGMVVFAGACSTCDRCVRHEYWSAMLISNPHNEGMCCSHVAEIAK